MPQKKYLKESIKLGDKELTIETGKVAKQADGAVVVRYGDTMILVTAVSAHTPREGIDIFPLTVEYRESSYSAGRIPGNYFRREARPNEKETLTCRLIDRPMRPLFPAGYKNVFVLHDVEGYEHEEVARILGCSVGTSKSQLHKARLKLRKLLQKKANPRLVGRWQN